MKTTKKITQYPTPEEQIIKKKLEEVNEVLSKTDLSKLGLKCC